MKTVVIVYGPWFGVKKSASGAQPLARSVPAVQALAAPGGAKNGQLLVHVSVCSEQTAAPVHEVLGCSTRQPSPRAPAPRRLHSTS